jgi:hypothetical protein
VIGFTPEEEPMPIDGYPTKSELKKIKHFYGTLPEFFGYVESLWENGSGVRRETYRDEWDRTHHQLTFITGGWSGCEETIGVALKTMASLFTHSKWERGGLFEFDVAEVQWNMAPMFWGWPKHAPKESGK